MIILIAGPWSPFITIAVFFAGPIISGLINAFNTSRRPQQNNVQPNQAGEQPSQGLQGWWRAVRQHFSGLFTQPNLAGRRNQPEIDTRTRLNPAATRKVHRLPIVEWQSADQVRKWTISELKREVERTGVHHTALFGREKEELVSIILNSWGGSSGDNCVVCLNDYCQGDVLRVLPCKHRFHVECIDRWLVSHSCACPLCNRQVT
mmetsp:Transcript_33251/g.63838  ORF Transcript_33251/g.63838 Transcript_33251/m.63838 type:complete len:205 (+) Transcript_33251:111-725(+)